MDGRGRDSRDGTSSGRDRHRRDESRERERGERDRAPDRGRERERDGRDRDRPSRPHEPDGSRHHGEGRRDERRDERPSGRGAGSRSGMPPRPHSRAGDADARPPAAAEQPAGLPKRGSANPLLAEAARLARERLARDEGTAAAAAGSDHDSAPDKAVARRGWRDEEEAAEEREEGEAEPGELPPEGLGGMPPGFDKAGADKKRKHQPIVWHTPPKAQRTEQGWSAAAARGMHHAQSSSGINALAGDGSPERQRPRSAAEIAQAELEAFAAAQAELEGLEGGYMKASPEVSSPEEEAHIQREASAAPRSRRDAGEESDGEEGASPGSARPKPASRWLYDDAEPAAAAPARSEGAAERPPPLDSDGPGAEAAAASDEDGDREPAGPPSEDEQEEDEDEAVRHFKREVSMLDECRSVDRYEKLNRINEGTYGVVYRARERETGAICALKKVKLEKERDGFPLTSVREINILLSLHHPNIVNVSEVVVGSSLDSVFMVMEYADHDLKAVMENRMTQPFSVAEVKCLMRQLLSGVAYLHSHWVLHRDLKTSNILYTNRGELKLCDFGLARQYGSPLKPYTHMVVTLWYRAIELLLGQKTYSTAIDVWSCGCIMAELLSREPLFPGKSEMEQISLIFKTLGTPTEETWPGISKLPAFKKFNFASGFPNVLRKKFPPPGQLVFDGRPSLSDAGFDLLSRLLEYSPERRITCEEALAHPWFREHPLPKDMALMPTFPATNDAAHAHPAAAKRKAVA